jgi:hypothetical protein
MLHKILILCTVLSISLLAFGQEKAEAPNAEIFGATNTSMQVPGCRASVAST